MRWMPQADRDFLDGAIANYNAMFSTSFSTDAQGFDGYYKDVSRRMKGEDVDGKPLPQDQCLDLLIVVDMFLTGFDDAKTLNTLWSTRTCACTASSSVQPYQPHPQLGQGLRQRRVLPQPRGKRRRGHRAVR